MQVTGVREFRNRAPELLGGKELVFVTRHGKLASIVVPMKEPQALPVDLRQGLLERLGEAVSTNLRKAGVTVKRVLRDFKTWREKNRKRRRRR
ncbi:MAG: type II toxin-antitoxin system Phd/YefM family antitoxin [Candidatus Lindowbacteria bacterium]|nr:type II toxin-antitoxin system Phd/YefM family antitoxin [Candidatus Lindowbacteria bacterium]